MSRRILFLVHADHDALERKGVAHQILERDENGFFDRVVTLHPLASRTRTIDLSPRHVLYERGAAPAIWSGAMSWRELVTLGTSLPGLVRWVTRIAREERVDLIRATDPFLMGLIARIVTRRLRVPYCVSVHADYARAFARSPKVGPAQWARRGAAWMPRYAFGAASLAMPISRHVAGSPVCADVPRDRVAVVPHGIDLDVFDRTPAVDVRSALGILPDLGIVSVVARLSRDTYVDDVLAIAREAGSRRDFILVIAGDGPERARVEDAVAADEVLRRVVRIVGFRDRDFVVSLRRASSAALVLIGGFSLLEACAASCPSIVYDAEWQPEVLRGGGGVVVAEHDVRAAAAALESLLDDPTRAREMGRLARAEVERTYTRRSTSMLRRRAYERVLERGRFPS